VFSSVIMNVDERNRKWMHGSTRLHPFRRSVVLWGMTKLRTPAVEALDLRRRYDRGSAADEPRGTSTISTPASATDPMQAKAACALDARTMPPFSSATVPGPVHYGSGGWPVRPARERIITTLLFTDIVGSTQRAAELGDRRWAELLARHHQLVERELARHGGRRVRWTGDGMLATFDAPAQALRCALALTKAARALGLELRAGAHTGECELRNGDVSGIAVHIAARVQAAARPGQVLASRTVSDLVAGSGLAFADRGPHVLKGVPGDWSLFAVVDDAEHSPPAPANPPPRDGQDLSDLSRRELEVLKLVAEGRTNDEIATSLYLSNRTIERHLSNTYAKLRMSGKAARAGAAARFSRAQARLVHA
jgi:class 3 adenylate cyclase/DNA-binding CsgD family transcriptional regulator